MDSEITRYIRENRDRYTREAIEARLIRAGYSPTEIDALWPPDDEQRPPVPQGRAFWRPFILSVIGMYGITFLVYAITALVWTDESIWPIILALLFLFLLSAGSISVDIVRRKRSAWASGTASSSKAGVASGLLTALVIPFISLVIVAGLCSALTGLPFTGSRFP
ncbi:MAG TPA: hypothetical protein VGR29_05745 [Thermomicrobiales bacterium]|nr:hypothetical protein [Thermomicrobiales bacterium]